MSFTGPHICSEPSPLGLPSPPPCLLPFHLHLFSSHLVNEHQTATLKNQLCQHLGVDTFHVACTQKKYLQEFLGWVSAVTHAEQHRAPAPALLLHHRLFARNRCIIFKVEQ